MATPASTYPLRLEGELAPQLRKLLIALPRAGALVQLREMLQLQLSRSWSQPVACRVPELIALPLFEAGRRIANMIGLKTRRSAMAGRVIAPKPDCQTGSSHGREEAATSNSPRTQLPQPRLVVRDQG